MLLSTRNPKMSGGVSKTNFSMGSRVVKAPSASGVAGGSGLSAGPTPATVMKAPSSTPGVRGGFDPTAHAAERARKIAHAEKLRADRKAQQEARAAPQSQSQ